MRKNPEKPEFFGVLAHLPGFEPGTFRLGDIREEKIDSILEADAAQGNRKSVLAKLEELKRMQEANASASPEEAKRLPK